MKKTIILLALTFVVGTTYSQNFKKDRSAAKSALENKDLAKAKEMIDKAITYPEAATDAEVYNLRGAVYTAIAQDTTPASKKLSSDPLEVVAEAYKTCETLDTKGKYKLDLTQKKFFLAKAFFNEGASSIQGSAPDYARGLKYFSKAFDHNKSMGTSDTLALYGYAFCNDKLGNKEKAIESYKELLKLGMNDVAIMITLSNLLKEQGKVDEAVAVLQKGLETRPGDLDLIINQANIYIQTKNHTKALANLESAKAKEPNNKTILFAVGVTYDLMKNDSTITAAQKSEYFASAEKAYKEAIAVDPNYFDANFNLGAMNFNKGGDIINVANLLPVSETVKYNAMTAEGNGFLQKAIPYLEKASEILPKDINTLKSLKEIYTRLNMMDKLKVVREKLEQ